MKKLSKTQQECIESMKSQIDKARAYDTLKEYVIATTEYIRRQDDPSKFYDENENYYEKTEREYYERRRNGEALSHYGKPTLKVLERLGLITVTEYSLYRKNGVLDWVKLNNY